MKRKFYISAIYTSPPGTMGGNTKIMLEIINNLSDDFDFIIFTTEPETFDNHLTQYSRQSSEVIPIDYPFKKFNYFSHYSEIRYIQEIYEAYFRKDIINTEDYFFTPSGFAPDVLPVYNLREKYEFKWLASFFLFIPTPLENIINSYKFPLLRYVIYYFYDRFLFGKILQKADLFLITNDYDRRHFPANLKDKIFAIYGGVNTEEIFKAKKRWGGEKPYGAVFCSRLHPQKGISQLLDVWSQVIKSLPSAKLAIIGNGEKSYERFLRSKAEKLGLGNNLKWFGYVDGIDKYQIYLQSKILLHGTIYDNNGMVAAEALCTGLPVIMYNLPPLKDVYTDGCLKVKVGDKNSYAQAIIETLNNQSALKKLAPDLKMQEQMMGYWDWSQRVKRFREALVT